MMRYFPKEIEEKWKKKWLKEKTYEPDLKNAKRPFYNLMMFPYPSAEGLHVGSVRTFTGVDIYGRMKRMQGYDVFEPMGLDGFGIHSENYALKIGKHPMEHAKDSEKNFYRQLSEIGNSFAWDEHLETYDPEYYQWTQWIFVQLFKHGLAYRKKSAVNWCPSCMTVLADEQVIQKSQITNSKSQTNPKSEIQNQKHEERIGVCERCDTPVVKKDLEQWFFRITNYADRLLKNLEHIDWSERTKTAQKNWIGKSEGALIRFPIATKADFVFLHGYKGSPDHDFFPWLKTELKTRGFSVYAPELPNPTEPNIEEQVNFLLKNYTFGENTVLITHSLGGVDSMKLLPRLSTKIKKLIMVAPPLRMEFLDGKERPALEKATDWKFDFVGIKNKVSEVVVIQDLHDNVVPASHPEEIAKKLNAELKKVIAPASHFNSAEARDVLAEAIPAIEVFTTRPDTLFGATYVVLAPEHPVIKNLESRIKNLEEVRTYIKKAKSKSEEERAAEGKEKTGVELKGIKVLNPANMGRIPVWVADYVLSNVGTGAIMAVPAHDERDFTFAKKFQLPIRQVIAPFFEDEGSMRKKDVKTVTRKTVYSVLVNPKKNECLVLDWKEYGWHTFIIGGVEDSEDLVSAATREIKEETGYKNIRFIKSLGRQIGAYFAAHKNENRIADAEGLLFELIDEDRASVSSEESKKHKVFWMDKEKISDFITISSQRYVWEQFQKESAYSRGGVLINSGKLDGTDSEKAKWGITKFVGGERKTQYRLRDWLISRQRYWGPPIPLIFCENCAARIKNKELRMKNKKHSQGELENPGWIAVPEKDLPVTLPYVKDFRPRGTGEPPLASVKKFYKVRCPRCKSWARRETDVSDTFLDSAWYYLGYLIRGSQKSKIKNQKFEFPGEIVKKWLPVDMYIGGAEHAVLHLLYVRFLAMAFYDWKLTDFEEPFKKFRAHGLITKDGAKMSKSKGNVVNPDEYIRAFGADAIRMYLAFIAPLDQGGDFRDSGIKGMTRFLERIWKISNFRFPISKQTQNSKLQIIVHKTIKKVTEDIESLQYNTAISALMILLNEFEANPDVVSIEDLKIFLKLLAPLAPYVSEELWQQLSPTSYKLQATSFHSVHLESWPMFDPKLIQEDTFELVIQVNGRVRGKITLSMGTSEGDAKKAALGADRIREHVPGNPKKIIFVPNKLINFVV